MAHVTCCLLDSPDQTRPDQTRPDQTRPRRLYYYDDYNDYDDYQDYQDYEDYKGYNYDNDYDDDYNILNSTQLLMQNSRSLLLSSWLVCFKCDFMTPRKREIFG